MLEPPEPPTRPQAMHSIPAVTPRPDGKYLIGQSLDNQIVTYSTGDRFKQNVKKTFRGHNTAGYACQVRARLATWNKCFRMAMWRFPCHAACMPCLLSYCNPTSPARRMTAYFKPPDFDIHHFLYPHAKPFLSSPPPAAQLLARPALCDVGRRPGALLLLGVAAPGQDRAHHPGEGGLLGS